jgi:hypothetical protein
MSSFEYNFLVLRKSFELTVRFTTPCICIFIASDLAVGRDYVEMLQVSF